MRQILRMFTSSDQKCSLARADRWRRTIANRVCPSLERLDSLVLPAGISGVQAVYSVTSQWASGFQGAITLNNSQATSVPNWKLEFDLAANITSIWNATITAHTGNHYTVVGASWDSSLPATSNSVSLGFVASVAGGNATPSNYVVTSSTAAGGGGGTTTVVPNISVAGVQATAPLTGTTPLTFTVSLSQATTVPVTVQYATADGTAKAGTAYSTANGTLTFAPGATQQTIMVQVKSDGQQVASEAFALNLSNPVGGKLTTTTATGTIIEPAQSSTGNFQFQDINDWGTGFSGVITITNPGTTAVNNWSLSFDFPYLLSSVSDATVTSHVGNHYVVQNAGWNSMIAAGGTASFGFNGSPGGLTAGISPTNYSLQAGAVNGGGSGSGGSGGGGSVQNPTALAVTAWTYQNQPTIINVLSGDTDPNSYTLTVSSITQGSHGSVVTNSDGTLSYTPTNGYTGADTFNYTISNGHGGTATAAVTVNIVAQASANWSSRFFAPYVDMTAWPTYNLTTAMTTANIKYFTLAFVVADSSGGSTPSWGGYSSYDINGGTFDQQARAQVAAVRSKGGDVMVSFGGENGSELAQAITNVTTLQTSYQTVIDAYNLTHIDFDIEGAAAADHASIDRRSLAMAALQKAAVASGKSLQIWLTLPALPTGLTADGLYVVQSAIKAGVKLSGVNIMTMDFGDSAAPNPSGQMGTYTIQSANSLLGQLQTLYGNTYSTTQLWSMIGVTPMIGVNDVSTEIFDLAAAQQVEAFAVQKGMGRISMWSLNRDQQDPAGKLTYAESTSSSILQSLDAFSKTFLTYQT